MKPFALAVFVLSGCEEPNFDQPLGGYPYETRLGFRFWWLGPGLEDSPTPEAASTRIDELALQWARGDARRDVRVATILPIQLVPAQRLAGEDGHYSSWTYFGEKVVVATLAHRWDSWSGCYFRGLEILIHEWDHVQFGEWHP